MANRIGRAGLCWAAAFGLALATGGVADEAKKAEEVPITTVYNEVSALETLYHLEVTPPQLERLRQLAPETAAKPMAAAKGKASAAVRAAMMDLRDALRDATDDEKIEDLSDKFYDLVDAEKAELDNNFEITDEARQRAPALLKSFTVKQVTSYLAQNASEVIDPGERLSEALTMVRGLAPAKWKEYRDEISDQLGFLIGGLDPDKAQRAGDQVVQLLIVVRSLKDEEFETRRPELEKKARAIVGDLGPTDVLRHYMEHALAELLSNPRLGAAVAARLKP